MTPLIIPEQIGLILETNNLRGTADRQQIVASLLALLQHLKQQSLPLTALAEVVITHDGLTVGEQQQLQQALGRSVQWLEIDPQTGYYHAKNCGFAASTAPILVFADSDCLPAADWLEQLVRPLFVRPELQAVAGRTTYAASLAGIALSTLDFMYFPSPLAPQATRNFYANNLACRRELFAYYSYQPLARVYRAHCQVLGLQLQHQQIEVHYAAAAHTEHRFPDNKHQLLQLRWLRGRDTVGLTPYLLHAYLPRWCRFLAYSGPIAPWLILMVRLVYSLRALNHQGLPTVSGLRRCAAWGLILGFSLLDQLGAIVRGLGLTGRAVAQDQHALSYHKTQGSS